MQVWNRGKWELAPRRKRATASKESRRWIESTQQAGEVLDELRTNAGAYVMPSRQEGLPLSLLEMLSYSVPVIASDIPAVHEVDGAVAEDRLTLVPPGDVAALRGAIDRLPWPGRPGTPGLLNWPTWADVAAQVELVYESIALRQAA